MTTWRIKDAGDLAAELEELDACCLRREAESKAIGKQANLAIRRVRMAVKKARYWVAEARNALEDDELERMREASDEAQKPNP